MKKLFSLIRACLKDNMSLFKFKSKSKRDKYIVFLLAIGVMASFYFNAYTMMEPLKPVNLEYAIVTLFIIGTTLLTFMEGIYKSNGILFNCKDDSLMLTLPIKRSTVFFVRMFKFYVFELIFNSLFLIPALACYAVNVNPSIGFYFISILALLLLPIIPIVLSTVVGIAISFISSKFKNKNIAQTIVSFILIIILFAFYYKMGDFFNDIASHAKSFNDIFIKIYYPAGLYINLILDFKLIDLIVFILINTIPFALLIFVLKDVYFNINSKLKIVKKIGNHNRNTNYKIVTLSKQRSFIKKEIKRLVNTPVYILNSCFGLLMYIALIALLFVKAEKFTEMLISENGVPLFDFTKNMSLVMLALIISTALLTNLTCSMISLEGKSFNILKSLPLRPIDIIMYKVNTTLIVEVPIILIGLIISSIKYKFNLFILLLLIICTYILPLISGLLGIIINIKFPKLDAKDDTEIVKQSVSSLISVMIGMLLAVLSVVAIYKLIDLISINLIILLFTLGYSLIALLLYLYAKNISSKEFEKLVI